MSFYDNDDDADNEDNFDDESAASRVRKLFKKFDNESHHSERIVNKLNRRSDINALILLDQILPEKKGYNGTYLDMIAGANHDIIYLAVDLEEFEKCATEENIKDLIRCGVHFDSENDSLAMFV